MGQLSFYKQDTSSSSHSCSASCVCYSADSKKFAAVRFLASGKMKVQIVLLLLVAASVLVIVQGQRGFGPGQGGGFLPGRGFGGGFGGGSQVEWEKDVSAAPPAPRDEGGGATALSPGLLLCP
ncbi:hypothetical protein FHG87_014691 [Trinorchestia longiramus]|nr:hypothetical protein FHG87_014691 [Trinorchestia longiramus]